MISELRAKNDVSINSATSKKFRKYGRIINDYNFASLIKAMREQTEIPDTGNTYQASVDFLEDLEVKKVLEDEVYGQMPLQIGYCNGQSSSLDGLEYHKSSEVNIAVTDLVLLLGKRQDISGNIYDANQVEAFYLPAGTAVELYSTTLHFAPCKVDADGFKCVVVLPENTNLPLTSEVKTANQEQELLFARNKWLLVHQEAEGLIDQGAQPGIKGNNITITPASN